MRPLRSPNSRSLHPLLMRQKRVTHTFLTFTLLYFNPCFKPIIIFRWAIYNDLN